MVGHISADAFAAKVKAGEKLTVLDVREADEIEAVRLNIAFAHVPLAEVSADSVRAKVGQVDELYVLCRRGKRAEMAAERLAGEGFSGTIVIDGGTEACVSCGILK